MATGHALQPGYGDPVSRLRRARSAGYPLDTNTLTKAAHHNTVADSELDSIKSNASRLWSYPQNQQTSYDSHYCSRQADEIMALRPTSSTRRNRPHPAPVFLVNRLHHVAGYQNIDTTIGKEAYRVDASLPSALREERLAVRQKYVGRQSGAWLSAFRHRPTIKDQLGGRSGQAAEAWLKIADEKDAQKVFHAVHVDEEHERDQSAKQMPVSSKSTFPSLSRWLRYAGAREKSVLGQVARSLGSPPNKGYNSPNPYHGRPILMDDSTDMYANPPCRGDFLIHPDWPHAIPHHRVR